ncbi:MAG: hypothetical protein JXR96_21000, partial [Deltaproteobacteria bacterium]|nr:hypothetical protein [Deltaproteobacteria bacterium]
MLESAGAHKRTYYFLPGERPAAEATPVSFELPGLEGGTSKPEASFEHKEPRSEHSGPSSEHKAASSEHNGLTPPLSSELES